MVRSPLNCTTFLTCECVFLLCCSTFILVLMMDNTHFTRTIKSLVMFTSVSLIRFQLSQYWMVFVVHSFFRSLLKITNLLLPISCYGILLIFLIYISVKWMKKNEIKTTPINRSYIFWSHPFIDYNRDPRKSNYSHSPFDSNHIFDQM